ncbi:MAG: hypothetical protein JSV04_00015 [Candidatus Heimdallarchaeota archaeon]|nr:MAG: hypothetical protein JSV04_00015 [Candidatus Heimdallarchaeota archaeon]
MSDYDTYIHYGRLLVILQFIFIPVYFYFLSSFFVKGVIWFLDTDDLRILSYIIVYVIGPLIMSVPFFFWTYGRKYQIGDAYESFGREIWRLPTTVKAFYGFNFVVGIIFIFPIITPVVSLFGGYFIAVYLLKWREEGKLISTERRTLILTLLYLPLPLLVIMGFYFGYTEVVTPLGEQSGILGFFLELISIWTTQLDVIYTSALLLADSATIGGFLYLIYEGAQQVDRTVRVPGPLITLISISCFLIFESLFLIFPESFVTLAPLWWIHVGAVGLGVIMLIIRYWKGLTTSRDTSIIGWLTLVCFQIVNFVSGELEVISRSTAIFLAFGIFFFLFWIAYRHAGRRY